MRITSPFIPLRVKSAGLSHKADVVGRSYTFGEDGMINSVIAAGEELLASPMRIVMVEDGEEAVFDNNYEENESASFIHSRSDDEAVIIGCKQSERFILDFCSTVRYDGNVDISLRLMTRGATVAQALGLAELKPLSYKLDRLWLEIPLKKEHCLFYHMYENGDMYLSDGSVMKAKATSTSGRIPQLDASVPFKPLFWLGSDERGLGWSSESDRNWQCENENKAIEVVHKDDSIVLRVHLLDSHPKAWSESYEKGAFSYCPLNFNFGFQATPVKPFPENPYIHKAFHLDCGIKIKGDYFDFLSSESRFDRLTEKGVDTLILHEKWNKTQNWFELSEFTANQLRKIVDECHRRGIKVLTYFGYELSTLSPKWDELHEKTAIRVNNEGRLRDAWWRVPFQRDYAVCYNSEYSDIFVNGIAKLMDTYNFDGVYLDGTARPLRCFNTEHGCGFYDVDGNLHGSYPMKEVRKLFEKLHTVMKERGGVVNVHTRGLVNYTILPYIDQTWYGENIQASLNKGSTDDVNIDYFRAEYSGRNMGVPVEFIAYENRPLWNFENALSCSLLHGILPRPNDINHPLELMSNVWSIFDGFPIRNSKWLPYWKNSAISSHEKVKISYYRYTSLTGEVQLLAFAVNISSQNIEEVTVGFEENVKQAFDTEKKENCGFTFPIEPYGYKILFVR